MKALAYPLRSRYSLSTLAAANDSPCSPTVIGQDSPPDFPASDPTHRKGTTMLSRSDDPSLDVNIEGDRAVVRISAPHFGSVDGEPADARLLSLIGELDQNLLALDFGNVNFMSSLGLALLLKLHKRLAASGRRLAVLNLQPHVYELFSVTRLDTVLDVRQQGAA